LHTRDIRKAGAAVTVSIVFQNTITIAYIGDCRAYLISRDCVEQIMEDHVTYMKVIELGYSFEVIPEREPQRVLVRAIGMSPDIEPDMARMSLLQDAALVLCSDGIHQTLSDDEIARIVRQANPPQAACDALVAAANAQGGKDNMSVVVVEVEAATGKSG
jgi:serine/threonine protein phosphatase PrpC